MPIKRRYTRRRGRRYTRRRRGRYTLYKTVRQVKKLKNAVETKKFQIQDTTPDIDNASWDIDLLNAIPLGGDRNDRNGASVLMKSGLIRAELISSAATPANLRFCVFLWKNSYDNLSPSETELFDMTDSGGTAISPITNVSKNWANRYNCRTLKDFTLSMGAREKDDTNDSNAMSSPLTKQFTLRFPINYKTVWGRNAGGSSMQQGRILFCYANAHGTSTVQIRYSSTIYYEDN